MLFWILTTLGDKSSKVRLLAALMTNPAPLLQPFINPPGHACNKGNNNGFLLLALILSLGLPGLQRVVFGGQLVVQIL